MFVFGILFFCNTYSMKTATATKPPAVIPASTTAGALVQSRPQATQPNAMAPAHQSSGQLNTNAQVIYQTNFYNQNHDNSTRNMDSHPVLNQTNSQVTTQQALQDTNQRVDQLAQQIASQRAQQFSYASLKNTIKDTAHAAREQIGAHIGAFGEWLKTNKYKLTGLGVLCCYFALIVYIARANHRINDYALWARWRIEDSFEQLASIPHKQLAQDLVFSIQRRYTNEKQFTDFIQPLSQFLHDVAQEKKLLKNYLTAGKWITRLRLQYILPINQKRIDLAKNLLQRLCFIEHVFLSWAAEFKIQQNVATS